MARRAKPLVLIAGGDRDFNLVDLAATLTSRGNEVFFLRTGKDHHPWISWQVGADSLTVDGQELRPSGAFIRHDVFTHLDDKRPQSAHRAYAWHTAVAAWLGANSEIRCLNRPGAFEHAGKPLVLHLAREAGLEVPETCITNHLEGLESFLPGRGKIAKPINGGGYCQRLSEAVNDAASRSEGVASAPAIIQRELVPPEYRIYRVGETYLGFEVISRELDYRTTQRCRLEPWLPVPEPLISGLGRLTDRLGLDFGAADFKTCPETGRLLFLEVNTNPMFAAFDRACDGSLTAAIAACLEGG